MDTSYASRKWSKKAQDFKVILSSVAGASLGYMTTAQPKKKKNERKLKPITKVLSYKSDEG